jgi:hypothetical protein
MVVTAGPVTAQQTSPIATPEPDPSPVTSESALGLEVHEPWLRASAMIDLAAAAYLVIHNSSDEDDALIGATSPAAGAVEIHQTSMDDDGLMAMAPVAEVPIPAHGEAVLEAGGYHIMLVDLARPLEEGRTIEITLEFAKAPPRTVAFSVLATGPMSGMDMAPQDETRDDDG